MSSEVKTASDLRSLLERVEKATGPDRDIDGAVEVQARRFQAYAVGLNDETRAKWQHNGPTVFDGDIGYDAERFTASIDAALALVGRVLPGSDWILETGGDGDFGCTITAGTDTAQSDWVVGSAPLAILAALLKALIARAEQ